jgi:GTP-binding protein
MSCAPFTAAELSAGEALFRRPWQFVMSVPSLDLLPAAERCEIAVAGRSNVGKSSLINRLLGRSLARTSNTPGRTQELNFYESPGIPLFVVDLPGYGFAEAPKQRVESWTRLVKDYLRGRASLQRVLLLVDARRGLTDPDLEMLQLLDGAAVSYEAVLTKADKVKTTELASALGALKEALIAHPAATVKILATSARTGLGVPDLRAEIALLAAAAGALRD